MTIGAHAELFRQRALIAEKRADLLERRLAVLEADLSQANKSLADLADEHRGERS